MLRWCLSVFAVINLASRDARAQGRAVPETEPNDSARTANVVTFGDTVTGVMGTTSDWDYFAVDIPANTKVQLIIVRHTFNRMYGIAGPDGNSIGKDGGSDSPDTLNFLTTTAGRHIVYMTEYGSTGLGPPSNGEYAVRIGAYVAPPPGPGDPVTQVVGNLGLPDGIAAGPSGELYIVADRGTGGASLTRVARDGSATVMATGLSFSGGIAIDGSGDLLVSTYDADGTVWRYSPAGVRTVFNTKPTIARFSLQGIAVGPDGDVWMADPSGPDWSRIWRFDPLGNVKDTIHIDVGRVFELAFSPAGELHFPVQQGGVYKLVNEEPRLVIAADTPTPYGVGWGHLVFDRDGYIYAVHNASGSVVLFDPSYHVVSKPFAWVVDEPGWSTVRSGFALAFGRDASGATTTQLLVARSGEGYRDGPGPTAFMGGVYELDRSAIRAPGWPLGKQGGGVTVSAADIANALMGGTAVSAEAIQFLDSHGNHNGVLDVGDLRAYLRAQGQLAPRSHRP